MAQLPQSADASVVQRSGCPTTLRFLMHSNTGAKVLSELPVKLDSVGSLIERLPQTTNSLGQPIGVSVSTRMPVPSPQRMSLEGRTCVVEPLHVDLHSADLYSAIQLEKDSSSWTYMHYGPFRSVAEYRLWMTGFCSGQDPLFYAIVDKTDNKAKGVASYQRISPEHGTIEVGHIHLTQQMQRTTAATEAMYLMMRNAFLLGYRRYEWKCDALNAPSHEAARRLGFTYEGIFRHGNVYKGRNRDIAWYSILDSEWPILREAFERWLEPTNFDSHGQQRTRLSEYMILCSPTWTDRILMKAEDDPTAPIG